LRIADFRFDVEKRGFHEGNVESRDMVVDGISHASLYYALGSGIEAALRYLEDADFSKTEPGRHDIGGGRFAIVQDYQTAPREEKRWEAHRKYIDVQYVASGAELMGYAGMEAARVVEDYDESKDVMFLAGDGSFVMARTGTFVILFPHDAHMPGVAVDGPEAVRKVVVKIPVAVE